MNASKCGAKRSRRPIWPAWETRFASRDLHVPELLNTLMADTTPWAERVTYDSFLIHAVLSHVERRKPPLTFVGCGEIDEWAHAGRYDQYHMAAHDVDRVMEKPWQKVQSIPLYRGKTTFIISAEHGRGSDPSEWKDHGEKGVGPEGDRIAVIGPDTPSLGERSNASVVTESQIAATIAALLGADYCAAFPRAAKPVADIVGDLRPEPQSLPRGLAPCRRWLPAARRSSGCVAGPAASRRKPFASRRERTSPVSV